MIYSLKKRNWRKIPESGIPWARGFNRIMSQVYLPSFDGPTLYIVSDYSGYERKSRYWTYSFLIIDIDKCREWDIIRRNIRTSYLKDNRRISFKNLNDRIKFRALEPFLSAANQINGLCVCIVQTKKMNKSFYNKKRFKQDKETKLFNEVFKGKWKSKDLNKMWTIVSFVATFIAGLAKPKQNIYWISDEDDMFANPARSADSAKLLSALTSMYVKFELGELGIMTTSVDEGDRFEEDLASISDLVAGSVADLTSKMNLMSGGRIRTNLAYPTPKNISEKTGIITSWFSESGHPLQRLVIGLEEAHDGMFGISQIFIE